MKRPRRRQWLRFLIYCALVFACAGMADLIGYSSLGRLAELRSYDLRFKLRGSLPRPEGAPITILAIDEEALSRVSTPLILWQLQFALVIDRLVDQRAGVIGVDFIFSDITKFDPEGQRALGEALLQAGAAGVPIVLAYRVRPEGVEQPPVTTRLAALAAGHTLAYANLTTDFDDFVRRQQLFTVGEDQKENPSFAFAIAERFAQKYGRQISTPDRASPMLLINFRGPDQFRLISFAKALEAAKEKNEAFFRVNFKDQMVLIGRVGGPGDEDLHSTPYYFWGGRGRYTGSVRTPGVEIHANAITTLLQGSGLRTLSPVRQRLVALLMVVLVALVCFSVSPVLAPVLSGLLAAGYVLASCLWWFPSGWWMPLVSPVAGAVLVLGAAEIADFVFEGREKRRLRNIFKRYVDDQVIEKILQAPEALALRGERKQITILFADIRDFTKRSEPAPAAYVVRELNEYLSEMVSVIQKNRGMVDKFIGDGIMAIFGAPIEDPDSAYHCVRAAQEMMVALSRLNGRFVKRGAEPLSIGIGIHTGEAVVGNIGSPEKMEYTAIGDAVNVASRIEGLTRNLNVPILISGETFESLTGRIPATHLGQESVKGRTQSVPVYSVSVPDAPEPSPISSS